MNEFNPFETLGIDPNESMPSRTPLDTQTQVNPIETAGQFNPFEQLNINVNGFQQPTANGKDTEVSSMLGINQFTPMTDDEKQSYVDALSDDDWNTWNQLKSEGYSFEARKALMENQDMLYDISSPGTGKYLQSQPKEPITSEGVQRYIDWYQDRAAGFGERVSDKLMEKALYKKDGTERESKLVKGIGGMAAHILGKATELLDDAMNLGGHQMELLNNLQVLRGKKDPSERAEFDRTQENYKSPVASGTSIVSNSLGLGLDIAYFVPGLVLNTLAQGDGPIARVINGAGELISGIPNLTVDIVADAMMKDPQVEAFINDPANEGMLDDIKEGLTYAGMLIMGKYLKSKKGALGETKAGMMMNQFRTRFGESLRSAIRKGKEGGERAKGFNESEGIEGTAAGRSNVRRATIEGLKQGRKERWNQETPIEEQPGLPDTRITPYEEKPGLSIEVKNEVKPTPTKTNTDLAKIAEETKLSENNINNLKSNPDLQTEFRNTIKPYLEANGKSNPEGVISEPVNDLVYDIKSGIDELRVQQANLNRSINNKKLTPVEKALIKEIEKIINKKEPKQIYNGLKKLTPEQLGLLERTVPNIEQRIQTIGQILDLTMEITKNDLVGRFLKFQAERPRRGLTGFAKKLLYDYVKDLYDQKGIQSSTESIDKFIDSLLDQQQSDIVETLYKKKTGGKLDKKDSYALIKMTEELKTKLNEAGYMPSTWKHVTNAEGKPYNVEMIGGKIPKKVEVLQTLKQALDTKFPGRNETVGEYLERKGVNISVAESSEIMRWIGDMDAETAQALYFPFYDRILTLSTTPYEFFLLHEYGHRVMFQLGTFEIMEHLAWIAKRDHITEKQAVERFAEFQRNYLQYGNLDGKDAETVLMKEYGSEFGKDLSDVMEKERKKIIDLFEIPEGDKKLIDLFEHIKKDTEVGQEITSRQPQALEGGPGKTKRISWLQQNIDPNIQTIEFNDFGSLTIRFKDGSTKLRSDYKKGLTKDQLSKVDTYKKDLVDIIIDNTENGFKGEGKFDYKTATNEKSLTTIKLKEFIEKNNEKVSLEQTESYPMKLSSAVDSEGNALSEGMNNYMKNSQVRDKNGNLILVRHGTNKNFDKWDKSTVGRKSLNEGYFGKGMYFTDDTSIAENYSERRHGGDLNPHVEEGYLNITKMFDWNKGYTKEEFKDFLSDLGLSQDKIAHYTSPHNNKIYILNGYDLDYMKDLPDANWDEAGYKDLVYGDGTLDISKLTDQLLDAGYDGAFGDNGEYNEYVIYEDSSQFKRKTNENPTWSDNFSKMEIGEQQQNPLIKSLIDQSIKQDVSGIRMREDGLIVGKYHGHKEMPVKAIMENFDELKLEPEIKELLEKQYEIWEQEEFDKTLQNIK